MPIWITRRAGRYLPEYMKVLARGGGRRRVFNLGHGILADFPVDNEYALVDTLQNYQATAR